MRHKERIKQAQSQRQWDDYVTSPTIKELSPDCHNVVLTGKMTFLSGVCGKLEKEIHQVFTPNDRLYCFYECINGDCTGTGFTLTSQLGNCIRLNKTIEGELRCDGKEDWKYLNASGCSCMTTFSFKFTPEFE